MLCATVSGLSIGTRSCVCNRCIIFVIVENLHLFFHSCNHSEEDILTRISDYGQVAKEWGFRTVTGSLTALLTGTGAGVGLDL